MSLKLQINGIIDSNPKIIEPIKEVNIFHLKEVKNFLDKNYPDYDKIELIVKEERTLFKQEIIPPVKRLSKIL
jgi:hypothetical protein